MNMAHPWLTPHGVAPHLWPFLEYQPLVASVGVPLHTPHAVSRSCHLRFGPKAHRPTRRRPRVRRAVPRPRRARAPHRDTYRTFLLREIPAGAGSPERRRLDGADPGVVRHGDVGVHPSLASPETARADDYTLEPVDAGHFIIDERPDLVRAKLIALAAETAHP